MNEAEFINTARDRLIKVLTPVQSLEVDKTRWTGRHIGHPADPGYALSLRVEAEVSGTWWIHGEIRRQAHPKQIRENIAVLQHRARKRDQLEEPWQHYDVLISPYLSAESSQICREKGVGYLDLSGNCHLEFGGIYLHIEGKPNRFKIDRDLKNLYSTKSSRVLRVLLQGPLQPHLVQILAHKAEVSMGLVSKVRKHLLDQELAEALPSGIRITKPATILDDWRLADDLEERTTIREYSLLETDHEKVAQTLHRQLGTTSHAFTQWTAAHLRQPHVPPQVTSVYLESFPDENELKQTLKARRVDRGGRLRIYQPKDGGVFIDQQEIGGLPLVSDIQIYLDLLDAEDELRANEAARELRELPDFSGGW